MSNKHFVMTFSVPVSDNLFAQAKVITAVEQAIDAFKGSLNGMDGYELTTDLIAKRQPKQPSTLAELHVEAQKTGHKTSKHDATA